MSFMRRRKLSKSLRQLNNSSVVYSERDTKSELEVGIEVVDESLTTTPEDSLVQRESYEEDETIGLFVLLFLCVFSVCKCELMLVIV